MDLVYDKKENISLQEVLKNSKDYIIVAIQNSNPCMVQQREDGKYVFSIIGGEEYSLKSGNSYTFNAKLRLPLKDLLTSALKHQITVKVFHKNNWREAFNWLILNSKK